MPAMHCKRIMARTLPLSLRKAHEGPAIAIIQRETIGRVAFLRSDPDRH
jgi:hypothetical protein